MLLVFDLTCFLSFVTFLESLPTEHFYSWQGGPDLYRLTQRSYARESPRRNDPQFFGPVYPVLDHSNVTESKIEPNSRIGQIPNQDARYPERRSHAADRISQVQIPPSALPYASQPSSRPLDKHRESFRSVTGEDFAGTKPLGYTEAYEMHSHNGNYSSHVNYEEENQNDEKMESTPTTLVDEEEEAEGEESGVDEISGVGRENNEREKINFEENSRNSRRGHVRKGVTNAISTTEKTVRVSNRKGSKRPRPNVAKPQSGQIIFPDGYRRQKFTPRGTKCGKKTTFCEHIGDEYPSEYINQVLKREGAMFREFFGKDVISDPNITERIHAPEENSLCPFRQEVVFPRAAKNKEDKWLFVVNQDQYVQGVTVEVCLNPESRCILTEGFPLGYTPYCKQKYIERRLVAIGEDGKPHSDSFRLPSCCSCVVKHDTSSRMSSFRASGDTSPAVRTKL